MSEKKDDGYLQSACDSCHVRFHKTERIVMVDGKAYHSHHAPKVKPVTLNAHVRPKQQYIRFHSGLSVH